MLLSELFEAKQIFYHGSNTRITKFDLANLSKGTGTDQEGPGIYLTSSADDARMYGKYVHQVEVNIVKARLMPEKKTLNPTYIRHLIKIAPGFDPDNWDQNPVKALAVATNSIMDAYGPNYYLEAMQSIWGDHYYGFSADYLKNVGINWDGFMLDRADGIKHLIWFKPDKLIIKQVL